MVSAKIQNFISVKSVQCTRTEDQISFGDCFNFKNKIPKNFLDFKHS